MCSNRIRAVLGKPVWLTVRAIDASETRSRRSGWRLVGFVLASVFGLLDEKTLFSGIDLLRRAAAATADQESSRTPKARFRLPLNVTAQKIQP